MSLRQQLKAIVTAIPTSPRDMLKAVATRLQPGASSSAETNNNDGANEPSAEANLSEMEEVVEGTARILHPKGAVFYNPVQVVNRDLSVLVLRNFTRRQTQPVHILEGLSATGLRSIRYFKELPNIARIVANDFDPSAVSTIERTVRHNKLDPETQVIPNQGDAAAVMALAGASTFVPKFKKSLAPSTSSSTKLNGADSTEEQRAKGTTPQKPTDGRYQIIDLDPYGSAAPFIEPAVRSIADGGLLAVTCTDLAVLCGNSPEKCYARYSATPLKSPTMHEMAVRIVLSAVQAAANRLDRAVEPVLCARIDFYIRLFLRVRDSKSLAQRTPSNTALVFQCAECGTQRLQPLGRVRSIAAGSTARAKRRRLHAEASANSAGLKQQSETTSKPEANSKLNPDETATNGTSEVKSDVAEDGATNGATVKEGEVKKKEEQGPVIWKFQVPAAEENTTCKCTICGGTMHIGGPIWTGPLIEEGKAKELIKDLEEDHENLKAKSRVEALVRLLGEEVPTVPLFMHLPTMCKVLGTSSPPNASIRTYLAKNGYKVSQSHTDPGAIKTDAPPELVWDILKLWVKKNGSKLMKEKKPAKEESTENNEKQKKHRSAGERILEREPLLVKPEEIDFTVKKDKFMRRGTDQAKKAKSVRYPPNPQPNWGPKPRAGKRQREEQG